MRVQDRESCSGWSPALESILAEAEQHPWTCLCVRVEGREWVWEAGRSNASSGRPCHTWLPSCVHFRNRILRLIICIHPSVSCEITLASLGFELLIWEEAGWRKMNNKSCFTQSTEYNSGLKNDEVDLYVLIWEDRYNKLLSGRNKLHSRIYDLIIFQ